MQLWIVVRVAISSDCFEQSIEMLIMLHAVNNTTLNNSRLYRLFVQPSIERSLASVRPVPFDYVSEQQKRR